VRDTHIVMTLQSIVACWR